MNNLYTFQITAANSFLFYKLSQYLLCNEWSIIDVEQISLNKHQMNYCRQTKLEPFKCKQEGEQNTGDHFHSIRRMMIAF